MASFRKRIGLNRQLPVNLDVDLGSFRPCGSASLHESTTEIPSNRIHGHGLRQAISELRVINSEAPAVDQRPEGLGSLYKWQHTMFLLSHELQKERRRGWGSTPRKASSWHLQRSGLIRIRKPTQGSNGVHRKRGYLFYSSTGCSLWVSKGTQLQVDAPEWVERRPYRAGRSDFSWSLHAHLSAA